MAKLYIKTYLGDIVDIAASPVIATERAPYGVDVVAYFDGIKKTIKNCHSSEDAELYMDELFEKLNKIDN